MHKCLVTIVFFLTISSAIGQPQNDWVQTYDLGNNEAIEDIYRLQNGNLAVCGYTQTGTSINDLTKQYWLMKLSDTGEIIWSNTYGNQNVCDHVRSIIEAENGDFVAAGFSYSGNFRPTAIRVNADGEEIWCRSYDGTEFYAIIELKSGEFLMCGVAPANSGDGLLTCIDGDGNVIWSRTYDVDNGFDAILSMRETNGEVVVVGTSNDLVWILKVDTAQGDTIWSRRHQFANQAFAFSITSAINGGFAVSGNISEGRDADLLLFKIDNQGEIEWFHTYDIAGRGNYETSNCIISISDGGYGLSGGMWLPTDGTFLKVDQAGESEWHRSADEIFENLRSWFNSVIVCPDLSVINAGSVTLPETDQDGFIVKFVPERSAPLIIGFYPSEQEMSVLQDNSIQFGVYAVDAQNDPMEYIWTFVEDTVSVDTFTVVDFTDIGDFSVICRVSDSTGYTEIQWDIHVDDFFIASTSPDSLRLLTRRGNTLPFTLDVACMEPNAPLVEWTVVNRDNDSEYLGEADTIEVCFDLAGDWAVEAEASWNGERESVRWVVDVRSAVWWWMPHEDEISVNRNERRDFSVFAFDPDSDSLSIGWWLDGDSLDSNAEVLTLDFPDIGEHSLVSIVRDGIEADTIRWAIIVNESGVESGQNGIPTVLALHPPAPNPFNSTTTIGYSLPIAGNVSLAVYDLSGREVARLVDGVKVAGNHKVSWTANDMASGVYVVAMDAGGVMLREKVVLVK